MRPNHIELHVWKEGCRSQPLEAKKGVPLPAGVKAGKGTLYTPVPTSPSAKNGTIGLITDPAVANQSSLLTQL